MKQYLGVIVMLIGAILLVYSYLSDQVEHANTFLTIGLVLVIGGYLGHIFLGKSRMPLVGARDTRSYGGCWMNIPH